ncbi:MAG: hypothetical protein KAS60_03880 [Thermoplasmata archaeon]|nr:hypothetical protein [Thermoplasmata archaeon]
MPFVEKVVVVISPVESYVPSSSKSHSQFSIDEPGDPMEPLPLREMLSPT